MIRNSAGAQLLLLCVDHCGRDGTKPTLPFGPTMSTRLALSHDGYRESAVLSASRKRLVVMLYDGACESLEQGAMAMREGDIGPTHVKLRRGEAIISYLQRTLDMEQGDIAKNLLTIYLFCRRHVNRAGIERDPRKVDEVVGLLRQLRDA
jgi:flagellar protein FliS